MYMCVEDHNLLFARTVGVGTDPVNQSRISRRRPRFNVQVDPGSVLLDWDAQNIGFLK